MSVIVTTHNEDDLLIQCLESIANQTWKDFEVVVVDDLSTDNTLISASTEFSDDERFRFIHNEDEHRTRCFTEPWLGRRPGQMGDIPRCGRLSLPGLHRFSIGENRRGPGRRIRGWSVLRLALGR